MRLKRKRKKRMVCVRCGYRYEVTPGEWPPFKDMPVCPSGQGHMSFAEDDYAGIAIGLGQ